MNDQNLNENENSEVNETAEVTEEIPAAEEITPTPEPEITESAAPTPPAPNYSEAARERVYIGVPPEPQPQPAPKKKEKSSFGFAAATVVILLCVVLSGAAAFVGTIAAGFFMRTTGTPVISGGAFSADPSIVFKDFENPNKEPGTYEQVSEAVSATVVEITTESIATDSYFWGNYVTSGAGSGVIISADGMIITNNHVVSGASAIRVRLSDGTEYEATVVGTDADTDIAIVKIEAENLPFALLGDSDSVRVGEEVLAVGNPLGELGGTVTNGIVSALSREVTIDGTKMTLIQMNAEVNPGNSGGGLFNLYGELIGVVNAKSTTSSSGISVEGIGFAIPINTAAKVADEIVNHGYVRGKPMLGINFEDIDTTYEAMLYRVSALGVYVTASSQPNLERGDRIVAIDGDDVTYSADIKAALTNYAVGDVISVTVVRNGKHVTVEVTLLEKSPATVSGENRNDSSNFENNFGN